MLVVASVADGQLRVFVEGVLLIWSWRNVDQCSGGPMTGMDLADGLEGKGVGKDRKVCRNSPRGEDEVEEEGCVAGMLS